MKCVVYRLIVFRFVCWMCNEFGGRLLETHAHMIPYAYLYFKHMIVLFFCPNRLWKPHTKNSRCRFNAYCFFTVFSFVAYFESKTLKAMPKYKVIDLITLPKSLTWHSFVEKISQFTSCVYISIDFFNWHFRFWFLFVIWDHHIYIQMSAWYSWICDDEQNVHFTNDHSNTNTHTHTYMCDRMKRWRINSLEWLHAFCILWYTNRLILRYTRIYKDNDLSSILL